MSMVSFSPPWFYGYDVILEICFAITAMVIGIFSLKLYKRTDQKQLQLFGYGFILIAASYIIQSLLNLMTITQADQAICQALNIPYVNFFSDYGIYAHIVFMTAGLTMIAFMTFKSEKIRIMWLLLLLSLIAIMSSINPLHTFFMISTILLSIILWHFVSNYLQSRQTKTLLVVLAFGFLHFGSLHFLLSVDHELYYAIGHILELCAYSLILANLYLVLHNGKKTR